MGDARYCEGLGIGYVEGKLLTENLAGRGAGSRKDIGCSKRCECFFRKKYDQNGDMQGWRIR